ncbi:hypothetical protein [Tabrizicola sp.]|jgi:hypothetical protein|uniref:hypothetical protein n=1 Tax=Tabrizicola sp. TaxID=2005166 RepID=UPI0035B4478A
MSEMDKSWAREVERRIEIYDQIEARDSWEGRMTAADYLGLLGLTVLLVAGFWIWGV